jgi:hypothetical protein
MRKGFLAALVGLLVPVLTGASQEELPAPTEADRTSTSKQETGPSMDPPRSPEAGLTFGQGLPSQVPWMPPPLVPTAPNNPNVQLPYFSAPPLLTTPPTVARTPGGNRCWGGFDYLMWWDKNGAMPSNLLTTGSPRDAIPGALGQPNTQVLYRPSSIDYNTIQGIRMTAGAWFDDAQVIGLEGSGFFLEKRTNVFQVKSNGSGTPLLAFAHANPSPVGSQGAFVATAPKSGSVGPFSGGVGFDADSQLYGAEANLLHALYWTPAYRVRLLGGVRYLDLDEHLAFFFQRLAFDGTPVTFLGKTSPSSLELADDSFQVHNQFWGPQVGIDGEYFLGQFFVGLGGKLAAGVTHEVLTISGSTTLQPFKKPDQIAAGGLFAQPSNIGRSEANPFAVVPQLQARLGWQPVLWLRGWIGYDFLYWSRVIRPGSQVDTQVDPAQVPVDPHYTTGPHVSPQRLLQATDFWAQGLSFGAELTF